jgi:hypothetical protein
LAFRLASARHRPAPRNTLRTAFVPFVVLVLVGKAARYAVILLAVA